MKKEIEITEQELKDLKSVRNYFGEHDKTMFEHKAYAVVDSLVKKLTIPDVITHNFMIRDRARLMKETYTNLGKRDTEWEKEYFKGILTLVNDIMTLSE